MLNLTKADTRSTFAGLCRGDDMRDIGKNIRYLRESKGLTQDQLAEKLFVTRQTISNYETGRTRPDVDMIVSIANVLETDANTVFYGLPADERKQNALKTIVRAAIE